MLHSILEVFCNINDSVILFKPFWHNSHLLSHQQSHNIQQYKWWIHYLFIFCTLTCIYISLHPRIWEKIFKIACIFFHFLTILIVNAEISMLPLLTLQWPDFEFLNLNVMCQFQIHDLTILAHIKALKRSQGHNSEWCEWKSQLYRLPSWKNNTFELGGGCAQNFFRCWSFIMQLFRCTHYHDWKFQLLLTSRQKFKVTLT